MSEVKRVWIGEAFKTLLGCVLILAVLWGFDAWKAAKAKRVTASTKPNVEDGAPISLEGFDFNKSPISLIVVTSPTCKYCQASKSFHANILKIADSNQVPVFFAVPSGRDAQKYLGELGVPSTKIKEYQQLNLSVAGTPTIIGVDNSSHVKAVWSGLATPEDEDEIVEMVKRRTFAITSHTSRIDAPNFQPADLTKMKTNTNLEVLDIRERDRVQPAADEMNIPLEELQFRASRELDKNRLQVVNCTNVLWGECKSAVDHLKKLHFDAATVGAGSYHLRCKMSPMS